MGSGPGNNGCHSVRLSRAQLSGLGSGYLGQVAGGRDTAPLLSGDFPFIEAGQRGRFLDRLELKPRPRKLHGVPKLRSLQPRLGGTQGPEPQGPGRDQLPLCPGITSGL